MKYALYARVSTEEQAANEYSSIDTQFDKLESYAISQDGEVVEKYSDPGFSAATMTRPALQKMLLDAAKGKFEAILFYKVDRLTRCTYDFYKIAEEVGRHNVGLVSTTQNFDTSTSMGRMMLNILLGFAQFERELTGERTRDKMYERAKRGMWNGGYTPIGYTRKDKKLIIDPLEEPIVKHIYDRFLQTKSLAAVQQSLKANGFKTRNGGFFGKGAIEHALASPIYTGKIRFKDEVFDGEHEGIIDLPTWETVQAYRSEKSRSHPIVKVNHIYLLKGLIRCQTCGSTMTPSYSKNRKKDGSPRFTYYYRCTSTIRKSYDACSVKNVNANWIEKEVLQVLLNLTENKELLDKCIGEANDMQDSLAAPMQIEKERLTKQLANIEKEAAKIFSSFMKDDADASSFVKDRLRDLDRDKGTLTKELDILNGRLSTSNIKKLSLEVIRKNFQTFHENFDELDREQKRDYIQLLVQQVVWDGETLGLEIYELPEGLLEIGLKNRASWLPEQDSNIRTFRVKIANGLLVYLG